MRATTRQAGFLDRATRSSVIVFTLAVLSAILLASAGSTARSQSSRFYGMVKECPFNTARDIPDSMTFDEFIKACDPSDVKPSKPESTVSVLPSGATKPEASAVPTKPSAPTPDRRRFRAYDGRAIEGQDLRRIENTSLRTCVQACRGNDECKAVTFDKWNEFCFLKRSVSKGFRIEPKAIVLVLTSLTPTLETRPTVVEEFRGRRFKTAPYSVETVRNYLGCKVACSLEERCEVFSYQRRSSECGLIEKPDEWFWNPIFDSGVKRQPPAN